MLGGIQIPYEKGLKGHSDADVVLHAMISAIFGAMGDGDIGTHFPDADARYKNIASGELLAETLRVMRRKRFKLVNVDVTVMAQAPKLSPHYQRMREYIARLCRVGAERISIKAATTEKLGWLGQSKGMAATAVVLVER